MRGFAPPLRAGAFALGLLFAAAGWAAEFKPWSGGKTPPLALKALDGASVDLGRFKGRVVVINFWATWCEPCRDEMPSLVRMREKLEGRPFELLTVNYGESAGTVTRFLDKLKLTIPVLLDPEKRVADVWRVRGLPMTFLVDAKGTVRLWTFGEHDWSEGPAFEAVERLVKEAGRGRR